MKSGRTQPSPAGARDRFILGLRDIKLAHSVFALPFAILAALLVAPRTPEADIDWAALAGLLALVGVCMVCARTWAMLVNRVADRRTDALNPRTAGRAFAGNLLSMGDGLIMLAISAGCFLVACASFGLFYANWLPLLLSIPVLAWIAFYSFTKRFTWLCHLFLGGALAISPLAAAIAVDPARLPTALGIWWLSAMVLLWVAGFDVIYALQDLEFDRRAGLNSIPARFGWRGAIWISRGLHLLALCALIAAWQSEPQLGVFFGGAVALVGGVLVLEHAVLAKRGRAGISMAFFTLNGLVSIALGIAGCLDIIF